jgi:hypothetical protein
LVFATNDGQDHLPEEIRLREVGLATFTLQEEEESRKDYNRVEDNYSGVSKVTVILKEQQQQFGGSPTKN